jgi:hypothetical protein
MEQWPDGSTQIRSAVSMSRISLSRDQRPFFAASQFIAESNAPH